MTGASIETTLELRASSLREVKTRMRRLFTQERVAASAGVFLDGLLGDERRKTRWMLAEAAGDPGHWRQQAILGRGRWDADALCDIVRDYVVETLGAKDAVLVIDENGFLNQGKRRNWRPTDPTSSGWRTSPMSRLPAASPTSRSSLMRGPGTRSPTVDQPLVGEQVTGLTSIAGMIRRSPQRRR